MEFKSTDYNEAFKKFADWIESGENRLNSACHCCPQQPPPQQQQQSQSQSQSQQQPQPHTPLQAQQKQQPNGITTSITTSSTPAVTITTTNTTQNSTNHHQQPWKHVIMYHQNLQNEVEEYGKQLNCELKRHLNEDKSLSKAQKEESTALEERWHKLWLKSLEQLVVVERTIRCPKHNTTIIGKSSPSNKNVSRPQRRRPISYPNNFSEKLEWDYQYTLSLTGCHKENGSQIDLDSVDEQVTKSLTEFGENYELYFGNEDEIDLHSRPPSVEPAEQPLIAKAVVTSNSVSSSEDVNCNLLMLTTPSSMFSVDASKCSHNQKHGSLWKLIGPFLFGIALLIFSALYHEPHHMHRSYYHSQPPV